MLTAAAEGATAAALLVNPTSVVRLLLGGAAANETVVVARVAVDYRRSIGFGAAVTVAMWISALGSASFTVDYDVRADGRTAVEASTVLVPVDPATFRPRRLDAAERAYLTRFVQERA